MANSNSSYCDCADTGQPGILSTRNDATGNASINLVLLALLLR